jgi:hypothetical protein
MSFWKKLTGGAGKVAFVETQRQSDGYTYDIYRAATRAEALAFLRDHEVKEECRYAIVETPQGNLGKDMVLIFDEKTGEMVELGKRNPLPRPKKSRNHCFRCGYPVLPLNRRSDFGTINISIKIVDIKKMIKDGTGFMCPSCQSFCCAICAEQAMGLLCVFCRKEMVPFRE